MATVSGDSAGIKATGLVKSYGSVRAVDGISFDIRRGEIVALLGPNGAGKTTTIEMVLGLSRPDAETVSLFGVPPRDAVASGRVGGMLQGGSVPDQLRVRELVELMASYYPRPLRGRGVASDGWATSQDAGPEALGRSDSARPLCRCTCRRPRSFGA